MKILREIWALLGSLKFAVFIILLFASLCFFGMLQESFHGADFANRLVYKSSWFFIIQILMFCSITVATIDRMRFNKSVKGSDYKWRLGPFSVGWQPQLLGFYVLHLGLLMLFTGSFLTFSLGLDGTVTLYPELPVKQFTLNNDVFLAKNLTTGKEGVLKLPLAHKKVQLGVNFGPFLVEDYIPFADEQLTWRPNLEHESLQPSAQYEIKNDRVAQTVTLSMNRESEFSASEQMGPLTTHLLPPELMECFFQFPKSTLFLWDIEKNVCEGMGPQKSTFSYFDKLRKNTYTFMPKLSPLPVSLNAKGGMGEVQPNTPWRIFNLALFESAPHLLFFGNGLSYFDKQSKTWHHQKVSEGVEVELPWMGFTATLKHFSLNSMPVYDAIEALPEQENGKLISGNKRAILLSVQLPEGGKKTFWAYADKPIKASFGADKYEFMLTKDSMDLPAQMKLTKFKMDKDPGTDQPASYESFVSLLPPVDMGFTAHIFMNNPLKYQGFTFYQASYFEYEKSFATVLSVNKDPGRWVKYLGALLLVLGSLWHFYFRQRRNI
jgi:hypothetical protein